MTSKTGVCFQQAYQSLLQTTPFFLSEMFCTSFAYSKNVCVILDKIFALLYYYAMKKLIHAIEAQNGK